MGNKQMSTVKVPLKTASIFQPAVLPLIRGSDDQNLLCGGCSGMITEGVAEQTLANTLRAATELLIQCPKCGAYNELPAPFAPSGS